MADLFMQNGICFFIHVGKIIDVTIIQYIEIRTNNDSKKDNLVLMSISTLSNKESGLLYAL